MAAVIVLGAALTPNWGKQIRQLSKKQILGQTTTYNGDVAAAPELAAIADKPTLTARSVLAYDVTSGSVLFSQDFDKEVPVASLTKIVSALVIIDSGKLNNTVTIEEDDIKVIGPNTGLVVGEKILVSELMKSMLIASHNDATRTLARYIGGTIPNFVDMMNRKAAALGMKNTHFTDPIGLDFLDHYSTALDLSLAVNQFIKNDLLNGIVKMKEANVKSVDGAFVHNVKTTNKLLLEDPTVVGLKTGYTNEAKGNLVIHSIKDKANVIIIVLGSDDREGDARKILDWMWTVYKW